MSEGYILKKTEQSLPLNWYFNQNQFEREIKKVLSKEWLYICHEDALSQPLSFHTVEISKFNILLVRDKERNINAYYNSCSHRGSILKKEKNGKLKSNLLICPYHQWSYDASNGNLVKTSSITDPKNFKKDKNCLIKVKFKIWNGLIFINLNNNAKWNSKKVFPDYSDSFSQLNVSNYQIGHTWKKQIKCNWKIFWENYSECLHCPNLHPELSNLVPIYGRRLVDIKDDPNWKKFFNRDDPKYKGGMKKGTETWSMDGSAQGHRVEYLENQTDFPGYIYMTSWPSMFLAIFTDHIRMVRILPLSNELTEVTAEWVFRKETLKDKKYSMKNVVDFAVLVMKQDAEACELNQKGIHNPIRKSGTLMPEEYEIKRFHNWLRKKL